MDSEKFDKIVLDLLYGPLYYRLLVGRGELALSQSYAQSVAEVALDGLCPDPKTPNKK